MNFELFIASRIVRKKPSSSLTKPVIRIAIISVALGLTVMILSVSIVKGFQKQIRDKVVGFGSHIQISNFDANNSMETKAISKYQPFYSTLSASSDIRHIQIYATKPGIIKTKDDIQGVVLKGIGSDFDWSFFLDKIVEGVPFKVTDTAKTNDILLSKLLAERLKLKVSDNLLMYFIQDPPRMRKFTICGIYETGMEEMDQTYVIGDIGHVQKLNNWDSSQISGFEVLINDFDKLDDVTRMVYSEIDYNLDARSISQLYPQIFDWLEMIDMNVIVILTLMIIVAGINMITTLLIIILERTNMIGILKALGTKNWSIRKVFLYNAAYIVGIGLIFGNILGVGGAILQQQFGIIKLDQVSYFVSEVPISLHLLDVLLLNIGTMVICLIMLIVPSYIVARITPVKAIRFS